MRFCKRCLYPESHPLNLVFDDEGICSGCRVHEEKDRLDWEERAGRLESILACYRGKAPGRHDCVVPVTGARDSYFIVDLLVRKYGMNPMLVSYNRHHNTLRGIRNLAYLRTHFDGDYMQSTVAPQRVKAITRETLHRMGSIYWHVLAGQTVFPVQIAVRFKIPLVIWGAHQGIDQVGMFSHLDEVEMTRKYRCDHDLMGVEAEDLVGGVEGLTEFDMVPFMYPHDRELSRVGVRGIYLNNYVRWDTKRQHETMLAKYQYEAASQERTFDTCNDVDCLHHSGIHDWVKLVKCGYGRVTDHATREIRLRRMTREQGLAMVARYQSVAPEDKKTFLDWVNLGETEFDAELERFRNVDFWEKRDGAWQMRADAMPGCDEAGVDAARLAPLETWSEFPVTPSKDPDADEKRPVLMAKGYSLNHRVRPGGEV
jgi:N-acetyl sugar amidotransferase